MKVAVITGGTRGIGLALTESYVKAGWNVVVMARKKDESFQKTFSSNHSSVAFVEGDVADLKSHRQAVATALQKWNRLDAYINNAGVSQWRPIAEIDADFWKMMIDVNLSGTFWGIKAAAEKMSSGGVILNISSLAGKRGSANNSAYCAAKFGVNGLTQSLAKELGPKGLRVNAVCPVYILTETLVESLNDKRSPAGGKPVDEYIQEFSKSQAALQRMPQAEEVAKLCLYLTSDAASAITAQCINVDCGVLPS